MKNPYLPSSVKDGLDFERWVTGRYNQYPEIPIREYLFEEEVLKVLENYNGPERPDTIILDVLYHHLQKRLRSFCVKLVIVPANGTAVDAIFQGDAFVFATTSTGQRLVVTLDVSFHGGRQDREIILLGDEEYLDEQNELYQRKRAKKDLRGQKNWSEKRQRNHFILSPNDLGRRGLKRLSRLIVQALLEQGLENE